MSLNDLQCRNAKRQPKKYRLFDEGGLYLEVMPNGSKYWRYKYRYEGKEKRLALGVYPTVSLMEARNLHNEARQQKKKGFDPAMLKGAAKQMAEYNRNQTFQAVAREWHAVNIDKWKPDFAREIMRRLEINLFPELGKFPILQLRTQDLYPVLKKIEERAPHVAKRLRQYISQIFCYAVSTGRAERDITNELKGAIVARQGRHFPSIDIEALPAFLTALNNAEDKLPRIIILGLKILMRTFVRRSELVNARWDEFDFGRKLWTIPASRMKMKLEHLVPLSRQVIADLQELKQLTGNREHLFAGLLNPRKPMQGKNLLKALDTLDYKGVMSCHGFRALAMGVCKERLKYRHEIPDRQLAHVPQNEITRAYDRAKYLDERIEMMQRYSDYLDNPTKQSKLRQRKPLNDYRPQQFTMPVQYGNLTTSYGVLAHAVSAEVLR
jgi:integrase